MKNIKKIALTGLVLSQSLLAVDLGSLDFSLDDGNTEGFVVNEADIQGSGHRNYGNDVLVDPFGKIYVVGTTVTDRDPVVTTSVRVIRYLPSGILDTSFSGDGIVDITEARPTLEGTNNNQISLKMIFNHNESGVIVGYSRENCNVSHECETDAAIVHINGNGVAGSPVTIFFDYGATFERQNEVFRDLVLFQDGSFGPIKIAVTFEVDRASTGDTDYGVALFNYNTTSAAITNDNNFDTDGKALCFFDLASDAHQDNPQAIIYAYDRNSIIIGGTVYEGDGNVFEGTNMGFCEFALDGSENEKWSTQGNDHDTNEIERLYDMVYWHNGVQSVLSVAGMVRNQTSHDDFSFSEFFTNPLSPFDWQMSSSLGEFGNQQYSSIDLQYLFVGETDDYPSELIRLTDGSFIMAGTMYARTLGAYKNSMALAKFTKNGILDTNWGIGHGGKAVHSFPASEGGSPKLNDYAGGLFVDSNQSLFVAGYSEQGTITGENIIVAKLHNDLIFANNFDF